MRQYILNLGLKSGRTNKCINPNHYLTYLKILGAKIQKHVQKLGEYDSSEEPTLVVSIEFDGDIDELMVKVCDKFTQECAPSLDVQTNVGKMHFNAHYSGEFFKFDSKYFELF